MGLDDSDYGTIRSNLLATERLPPLNKVYSTLIQEERVKVITRAKEECGEIMGLAVQTSFKPKGWNEVEDKAIIYSYCCLLYTSPSPRDGLLSRMPSSA